MSTHHRLIRRAQLRSRAICEPHRLARSRLLAAADQDPVIEPAGIWQRRLEGHLFRSLGFLHIGGKHSVTMRIARISAHAESLEICFSQVPDAQVASLANALPTWYPGDDDLVNGYPGLRYRPLTTPDGISFYLLGKPCSIILRGLDIAAFEEECRAITMSDLDGARMEHHLHRTEEGSKRREEVPTDIAVSAIIRRAGLFLAAEADSIDLWPTRPDRLSVEIITQDRSRGTFDKIIAGLTSRELSPRMIMTATEGHNGYRTMFQLEASDVEIDLRVQTL